VDRLAARLAPTHRVLSVSPRPGVPYQVATLDLVGVLEQFGFISPVVLGERAGCLSVMLVAAWYPERVGRVVLVDPTLEPEGDDIAALSLRECPPDWRALRAKAACEVLELSSADPALVERVKTFLEAPLP
jgi:pimeloyl-ACP methyl ester carboxylesterase